MGEVTRLLAPLETLPPGELGRAVEVHARPCARCPSAHWPPDEEAEDYLAAPRDVQLDSVFRCAWRRTKACRGYCDFLGITEADLLERFGADGMREP